MHTAELILALLIAVAALVTIARHLGIAYPIFLVIGGLGLGLVPRIPRVEIDPNVIFLIVLPPLLYIAAYFTPVRNLRANLGTISSLAVALVFATALTVAMVAACSFPAFPGRWRSRSAPSSRHRTRSPPPPSLRGSDCRGRS